MRFKLQINNKERILIAKALKNAVDNPPMEHVKNMEIEHDLYKSLREKIMNLQDLG